MHTVDANRSSNHGPIDPDWTIAELVIWLSDDARQHDATLRQPLARIEALATGSRWARTPSTVALIRSLAGLVRDDPALRGTRIRDLGTPQRAQTPQVPRRIPQLA